MNVSALTCSSVLIFLFFGQSITWPEDFRNVNWKTHINSEISCIKNGSLWLVLTNNNQHWKCSVVITSQKGDYIDSLDTSYEPQLVQLPYGTYNVRIQALDDLVGVNASIVMEDVVVKSDEPVTIQHDFKSAWFEIIPRLGDQNIDCDITVKEDSSWQTVATARSHEAGSKFLINPGNYQFKVVPLGDHQYLEAQLISIRISQGYDFTKVVLFQE